jgi:hypothetical protein
MHIYNEKLMSMNTTIKCIDIIKTTFYYYNYCYCEKYFQ